MPITELRKPCVEITCDVCGMGDNSEYECCFHHGDIDQALTNVRSLNWRIVQDESGFTVTCESCVEAEEAERDLQERKRAGGKEL